MTEISRESQVAKLDGFDRGFIATHLISIGARLGLFRTLNEAKEGLAVQDLSLKLELHEPYVDLWCKAAYALEILDCDDDVRFRLQPWLDEILADESHFRNMVGGFKLKADVVGEFLRTAPDYYRTGEVVSEVYTPEVTAAVGEATKGAHLAIGFYLATLPEDTPIKQRLAEGARLLDIGCGAGNFVIQLAQTFVNSRFVGVDPDSHGVEAARSMISQLGLAERVSVENLGGEEVRYEAEFDVVSMFLVFHEILPDVRVSVVENAYRSLRQDGQLLVFDFRYPDKLEDFRDPGFQAGIMDQFFETCLGVVHLSAREQDRLLATVGFRNILRTSLGPMDIVTATK